MGRLMAMHDGAMAERISPALEPQCHERGLMSNGAESEQRGAAFLS